VVAVVVEQTQELLVQAVQVHLQFQVVMEEELLV
jgi:hypothetical protein